MYNEYILKEMVKGRIEDARREAAEDSAYRQMRRQNSSDEHRQGGAIRKLVDGMRRVISRRSAEAHG